MLAKMSGTDDNSVDTTTLTKRQRLAKVTEHLQGLNLIPQATDTNKSSKAKKQKSKDKVVQSGEDKDGEKDKDE
eukprot:scaffold144279_cov30-Attheya_sp.AAC.1